MAPRARKKSKRSTPSPAPPAPAPQLQSQLPKPPSQNQNGPLPLIITSEKRRGLYECDYCRTDLSQVPRICCAICPDFDLCLECFTNQEQSSSDAGSAGSANGIWGGSGAGVKHDRYTHGYRVCDSTRFFMFPSLRGVQKIQMDTDTSTNAIDVNITVGEADFGAGGVEGDINANANAGNLDVTDNDAGSEKVKLSKTKEEADIYATRKTIAMADAETETEGEESSSPKANVNVKIEEDLMDVTMTDSSIHDKKGDEDGSSNEQDDKKVSKKTSTNNDDVSKSIKQESDTEMNAEDVDVDVDVDAASSEKNNAQDSDVQLNVSSHGKNVSKTVIDVQVTVSPSKAKQEGIAAGSTSDDTLSSATISRAGTPSCQPHTIGTEYTVTDDVKNMWTAEEDLRLLDAISTLGLGNWIDISEEVAGTSGTTNKNPKKCMERYLYDYLGKYGEILPHYTLVEVKEDENEENANANANGKSATGASTVSSNGSNSRKRLRSEMSLSRQSSSASKLFRGNTNKEYTVVPTPTLPDYDSVWPNPYLPPIDNVNVGDDVGRDLAIRAENSFVKAITTAPTKDEAIMIRKDWEEHRLNKHGGPTVLPPCPDDVSNMQGSDLAGFMPRRGDFDFEWDNDAEKLIQDVELVPSDSPEERAVKIRVLEIYNSRLHEREKRKQFLIDRGLLDYRKKYKEENKLPSDERDLLNRMRLFARFQSPDEHDKLIQDILKAKRLRKEIARLQMYRRMGFTSMADAERFELDRNRREVHRLACEQREKEEKAALAEAGFEGGSQAVSAAEVNASYMKQYKQNDRSKRRSISNNSSRPGAINATGEGPAENSTLEFSEKALDASDVGDDNDKNGENGNKNSDGNKNSSTSNGEPEKKFNVRECEGYELLTKKELDLCQKLELLPRLYNEAKSALIRQSLKHGLLNEDVTNHRSIFKIDVEKRGDVIDFILQTGWLPLLPNGYHKW